MDCVVQHSATRDRRSPPSAGSLPVLLLVAALVASCGPSHRPDLAAWRVAWAAERADLPTADDLEGPDARTVCERLLVSSRTAPKRLLPSPDKALDRAVEQWIDRTGGLAFDCPGAEGDAAAVRSAMQELDEIAAEIEAALRVMGREDGARGMPAGR